MYRAGKAVDDFFGKSFVPHIERLFTVDVPAMLDILKETFRIGFDEIVLFADRTVLHLTVTFGHLPSVLGAPFRAASADIRKSMTSIQGDVRAAAGNIEGDLLRIHGRSVAVNVGLDLPPGVSSHDITGLHGRLARGTSGAAGGAYLVGEQGPELVTLPRGAQVLPAGPTARLMGALAAGTASLGAIGASLAAPVAAMPPVNFTALSLGGLWLPPGASQVDNRAGRPVQVLPPAGETRIVAQLEAMPGAQSALEGFILEMMRRAIRTRGGNVQKVLGRV
jgi:hypothetical protein